MSIMIMFGDDAFDRFSVKEQHIIETNRVRVREDITRIAAVI